MVTWSQLRSSFTEDATVYWEYWRSQGLDCPLEVFAQLFYEHVGTTALPALTAAVDWSKISWLLTPLTGEQLRWVHVDRHFEHAVNEAYLSTLEHGIADDRLPIIQAWESQHTWILPPVLIAGEVLDTEYRHVLLVGSSRLGNLLGLMGRGEIPSTHRHGVWLGRPMEGF